MTIVAEELNTSVCNVTEFPILLSSPEFGGLYMPPEDDFSEIPQKALPKMIKYNQRKPLKGYSKEHLEFFQEEIYMERIVKDIDEAEKFINDFFSHFSKIVTASSKPFINKLEKFVTASNFQGDIRCRFEVVSGDNCKKFHVDNVINRLIYTCAGPGTEIKHPDSDDFLRLPTGSALILKGLKYPNFRITTLHRSPTISHLKTKRLLFIADYNE